VFNECVRSASWPTAIAKGSWACFGGCFKCRCPPPTVRIQTRHQRSRHPVVRTAVKPHCTPCAHASAGGPGVDRPRLRAATVRYLVTPPVGTLDANLVFGNQFLFTAFLVCRSTHPTETPRG
jgi:hypothetical protein